MRLGGRLNFSGNWFFIFFKKRVRLSAKSEFGRTFGTAPDYSFVDDLGSFVKRWKFFETNVDAGACFRNGPIANVVGSDLVHTEEVQNGSCVDSLIVGVVNKEGSFEVVFREAFFPEDNCFSAVRC